MKISPIAHVKNLTHEKNCEGWTAINHSKPVHHAATKSGESVENPPHDHQHLCVCCAFRHTFIVMLSLQRNPTPFDTSLFSCLLQSLFRRFCDERQRRFNKS